MAEATFVFPREFLWGTATSSHQVEGHNTNNNWYRWEQEGRITDGSTSGKACDWWGGRWREDFDRASETGQNCHRLSVEWSRVQPSPDRWDEDALEHYRQMVRGAKERGLTAMVTLHHFTDPLWFADMGGWENENSGKTFQGYVHKVVDALGDYVAFWCTINEPNVLIASSYLLGTFPPGKRTIRAVYQAVKNQIKAHVLAYHTIHQAQAGAQVGMAHHYRGFRPSSRWSPLDIWATKTLSDVFNQTFPHALKTGLLKLFGIRKSLPQARGTQDYFGINYYTSELVSFSILKPLQLFTHTQIDPEAQLSPTGFIANQPDTFFKALNWAKDFDLPVYITENGIEDVEDKIRPRYLTQHIHQVWRGVNFNWPIRGYFHWTLVDNFEWERGWSQRFGLWGLNPETQERQKRKSASLYEAICKGSALSSEMVATFVPELLGSMFPG
jgi:beta-glucosidase